ncbi:hypothetical protein MYCTH_2115818 [Thermothelomyces thermophilus ATCC 42464]|uniref:Uncharacterized protein n=1 Tax=Thermothelomyces thermophilus (strain ATCC 42464 / BCRC 31852 / DSM 1799) TaxID=573729 RepID=G2Q223_THET4|nr:uncharacterized protein MYCTH_2115818 [Thermothelomyces thermophilus ATCC 42464]AEO55056.1 hypothetical protein MYCTH_2115818 [Thermothelomyces thermophilus ATCC 42464]
MNGAVQLSDEQLRDIYADSYTSWLRCYTAAIQSPALPVSYLSVHNAFTRQPSFPATPLPEHGIHTSNNRRYITGDKMPTFRIYSQFVIGSHHLESWFPGMDCNYLSVLILAWAFILSARWSEIMRVSCDIRYLTSQALPPSFAEALEFLDRFCLRHNIVDQSHAALAAALLLPSISESMGTLHLPPLVANALTAIDSFAVDRPLILGRMMMDRAPKVAFFWIGATVLGIGETLLTRIRLGSLPADLNTAAWSDTLQHFIQQPVQPGVSEDGKIARADYCRLLALTLNAATPVFPTSPWKPFGLTPLELAGPSVQLHAAFREHQLQYLTFFWFQNPGITAFHPSTDDSVPRPRPISVRDWKLAVSDESASKGATQAVSEYMADVNPDSKRDAELWQHEWLQLPSLGSGKEGQREADGQSGTRDGCEESAEDEDYQRNLTSE